MTKNRLREQDPHIEREKKRYPNPIPSREYILQVLSDRGVPMSADELARELEIEGYELSLFNRRLQAMEELPQRAEKEILQRLKPPQPEEQQR